MKNRAPETVDNLLMAFRRLSSQQGTIGRPKPQVLLRGHLDKGKLTGASLLSIAKMGGGQNRTTQDTHKEAYALSSPGNLEEVSCSVISITWFLISTLAKSHSMAPAMLSHLNLFVLPSCF